MAVRGRQQGIHFRFIQIGNRRLTGFLEGDQANLGAPVDVFGVLFADKSCQGMNAAQPLIACAGRAATLLFHVGEEQTHEPRRQIVNGQAVNGFVRLTGGKRKQSPEHVAVAFLGVHRQIAVRYQMFQQKTPNPGGQ